MENNGQKEKGNYNYYSVQMIKYINAQSLRDIGINSIHTIKMQFQSSDQE